VIADPVAKNAARSDLGQDRSILFIANGGTESAAAERARRFATAAIGRTRVLVRPGGRFQSLRELTRAALAFAPDLVYCVDLAFVPVVAGILSSRKARLIVDTGDYPSAYFRQVGAGFLKVMAARGMEEVVYRRADAVVVRGAHHAAIMRGHGVRRVAIIPDGVDLDLITPEPDLVLRERLGLRGVLTLGIAGYFTWFKRLGGGLGSEVVRALSLLRDLPIHGVLVGSGPGLPKLRMLATELGVADRLHILGWIPYRHYSRYLSLIDICLLTQTNDLSSWVRTTGKLPGYLASGRYILASAVGTAQSILPDEMLIPYAGRWDDAYPAKVAARVRALATNPDRLTDGMALRSKAEEFAYPKIAVTAAALINEVLHAR
jgi:glycosyltransferase involved in cell wall biosynthesis